MYKDDMRVAKDMGVEDDMRVVAGECVFDLSAAIEDLEAWWDC